MKRVRNALSVAVAAGLFGLTAQAAKIQLSESSSLNVGAVVQPRFEASRNTVVVSPTDRNWSSDFYIRRARFNVGGNFNERLSFFVQTDMPNLNRPAGGGTFLVQDAFVSLKTSRFLTVDAGLLVIPLSRHGLQSATSMVNLDLFAAQVLAYAARADLRDMGLQVRGLLANKVSYRLGVYEGVSTNATTRVNPEDMPRFAGQVRYSVLGTDDALFYPGWRFAKDVVVSVGVGADYQSRAVLGPSNVPTDYLAASADLYVNVPLVEGQQEVVFQVNATRYERGAGRNETGTAAFAEAGYRYQQYAVYGGAGIFQSAQTTEAVSADTHQVRGGLAWFPEKNNFNVKLDLSNSRGVYGQVTNGRANNVALALQTQLVF